MSIFFSEPTLTIRNLNNLLDSSCHDWYDMGMRMDIPPSKRCMLRQQNSSDIQCSRECARVYLTEHPSPKWQNIAYGLYCQGHIIELQVVQRNYLKGE